MRARVYRNANCLAGGVFGGHPRELPQEAGGVRAEPAEDLGDVRYDFLAARKGVRVVDRPRRHKALASVFGELKVRIALL